MIVDACPYWTNPTTGGGPERVSHLCGSLSECTDVMEVSFRPTLTMARGGRSPLERMLITVSDRYRELQYPHVPAMATSRGMAALGIPQDLYISSACSICEAPSIRRLLRDAETVQIEHPWLCQYVKKAKHEKAAIILSTHNCETKLAMSECRKRPRVIESVASVEAEALKMADHILAVSQEDVTDFSEIVGVDVADKTTIVPNGVECGRTVPTSPHDRDHAKRAVGIASETVALFMGSRHTPNSEAVEEMARIAPELQKANIRILIVGSVGEGRRSHDNLMFTGHVKDYRMYLRAADIAVNPLRTGSGSSLKTLEYLAAGLPVVTTPTGARGIDIKTGIHAVACNLTGFADAILALAANPQERERLGTEGRRLTETDYDWAVIGRRFLAEMTRLGIVKR